MVQREASPLEEATWENGTELEDKFDFEKGGDVTLTDSTKTNQDLIITQQGDQIQHEDPTSVTTELQIDNIKGQRGYVTTIYKREEIRRLEDVKNKIKM